MLSLTLLQGFVGNIVSP